jgi:hypothetical protein
MHNIIFFHNIKRFFQSVLTKSKYNLYTECQINRFFFAAWSVKKGVLQPYRAATTSDLKPWWLSLFQKMGLIGVMNFSHPDTKV